MKMKISFSLHFWFFFSMKTNPKRESFSSFWRWLKFVFSILQFELIEIKPCLSSTYVLSVGFYLFMFIVFLCSFHGEELSNFSDQFGFSWFKWILNRYCKIGTHVLTQIQILLNHSDTEAFFLTWQSDVHMVGVPRGWSNGAPAPHLLSS